MPLKISVAERLVNLDKKGDAKMLTKPNSGNKRDRGEFGRAAWEAVANRYKKRFAAAFFILRSILLLLLDNT